ncbi:hypothetical protein [Pedobacter sp. MC2016-24]|uniref:hypothetical protein n=1 Tax=Pedobacter sp. MC2016-24 TaxID=2780090 RepID=UPI00187FD29A|nr:hypothetical protein [Pedobacter sp. MC2016-24]MBE9599902.1 hypothetical protein [Pedobacter sp. MC2016-24]
MFKKIHSNRDPEVTFFSELRKEFGSHFLRAEKVIVYFLKANPRPLFALMLVLIIASSILSFTVFRDTGGSSAGSLPAKSRQEAQSIPEAASGFDRILETGAALKETIAIKSEVEGIIAKRQLSAEDSVRLSRALDRLEHLQKSIK